jgi:hypothetical protein
MFLDPFRQPSGPDPLGYHFDDVSRQRKWRREHDGFVARHGGLDRERAPRVLECNINDVPEVDRIRFRHASPGAEVASAAGKVTRDRAVIAPAHGNDTVTVPLTIPPLIANVLDVLQASGACPPVPTMFAVDALLLGQEPAMGNWPGGVPDE